MGYLINGHLSLFICLVGIIGIILGISQTIKAAKIKNQDFVFNGGIFILISLILFLCGLA